ncbi:ribosomal L7Ae/L30e/S12e/Gadd45 family protein [Paenibacillus aquistagni]|uniref:ribosomal L7Ae/L30e/S12e/Gadd45 family protein n=1 Tax=Paenibacillus aquistagni TaxID=1852522 RepID=UPI000B4FD6CA|nr:ribosomal L7Ae/L30e/S12e/Gadd45 family protein [Paenibacillus aquistagni]NMM55373.1 50S ribosomal protein L7ae-like protein [Paenibacillus aquistagni]
MSMDNNLQDAKVKIGTKQTMKMVEQDLAIEVFVALDADAKLISKVSSLCRKKSVKLTEVATMKELGKVCGIDVGAAMVAVVNEDS